MAKSDQQRQFESRTRLKQEFGSPISINLDECTKERLVEIFNKVASLDPKGSLASKRSKAVGELINQYYIDNILNKGNSISEEIYETYNKIWEYNFDKIPHTEIISKLNEEAIKIPCKGKDTGKTILKNRQWNSTDIEKISSTSYVVDLIINCNLTHK
ncbi:hypothetical protein [Yersinia intermedia]|uniref:hypothetical protein n=1 Tax=Yersinia intermedia TaxID=631 RepID=UPI0005DB2730|nr:hypothetical protein [Yersinia intermedia]MCB5311508.1 hypothetical protein [Yersinia intermedia]MCB5325603.1 hypothetical protein [Yersinia intermedia]CNH70667.1 Uncharacterised protein [Yersinia intermedia]